MISSKARLLSIVGLFGMGLSGCAMPPPSVAYGQQYQPWTSGGPAYQQPQPPPYPVYQQPYQPSYQQPYQPSYQPSYQQPYQPSYQQSEPQPYSPAMGAIGGGLLGAGAGAAISAIAGGRPAQGALIGGGIGALGGALSSPGY